MVDDNDQVELCSCAYAVAEFNLHVLLDNVATAHLRISHLCVTGVMQGEDVGTGLLTYPLLMASDILLYQVSHQTR